jgi:integrase
MFSMQRGNRLFNWWLEVLADKCQIKSDVGAGSFYDIAIPAFPHLIENNVRKGFLEDGQYRKIVAYCPELWFRSIVECGRTYGWRISELRNMQVGQIDLQQRVIRLEPGTTKNGEGREVLMTDAVYALLTACVSGKAADDYVFTRSERKGCATSAECGRRLARLLACLHCYSTTCGERQGVT